MKNMKKIWLWHVIGLATVFILLAISRFFDSQRTEPDKPRGGMIRKYEE